MMKSAPGRFSTITGCFQRLAKASARVRATASGGLPAEPVIIRTVRVGQALSASAAWTAGVIAAIKATNKSVLIVMTSSALKLLLSLTGGELGAGDRRQRGSAVLCYFRASACW